MPMVKEDLTSSDEEIWDLLAGSAEVSTAATDDELNVESLHAAKRTSGAEDRSGSDEEVWDMLAGSAETLAAPAGPEQSLVAATSTSPRMRRVPLDSESFLAASALTPTTATSSPASPAVAAKMQPRQPTWGKAMSRYSFSNAADDGVTSCLEVETSHSFSIGASVYCALLLRGVTKAVKAVLISSGPTRTVLACPATVSVAFSGEWVGNAEACCGPTFDCACTEFGKCCKVVFYDVNTMSLSSTALPRAIDFQTADGEIAVPATQGLLDIFRSKAGGDAWVMQTSNFFSVDDHDLAPSASYHEVNFGGRSETLVWNSVLMIPDFLSKDECHVLIEAADRSARSGSRAGTHYSIQAGMNRVPVRFLDLEAQMLSTSIFDKLINALEERFSNVCVNIFGQHCIKGMKFAFWPGEPAVNRYMVGGGLDPHTDKRMLTINIPLSDLGAFTGGGTIFWPQEQSGPKEHSDMNREGGVVVRPLQGTAVLFNGSVTHAARYVTSGIRHIFSASFNLWSLDEDS